HRVTDSGASPGKRLEVDLGRVSRLHVRWREEGKPSPPPTVLVREAYLWTIRPGGSNLSAPLHYTGGKGIMTQLAVDLPEGLEVRRVGVSRLPMGATDESGPRLHQWTLTKAGSQRRVQIELQRPVADGLLVLLDLVPRQALGRSFDLP